MKTMILAAVAALFAVPAFAQPQCMPRENLLPQIAQHGEGVVFRGLGGKVIVEVWLNPETNTWTVTLTRPDGTMCVGAFGEAGETMEPVVPTPSDPA